MEDRGAFWLKFAMVFVSVSQCQRQRRLFRAARRQTGLVLLFVVLLMPYACAIEENDIQVGKAFPLLSLPSLQSGAPASVQDFRGQKVVLHIWAAW